MDISRNKQHENIITVIYNELVDFNMGEGKVFRDARELICGACDCSYEEVPDFIKDSVTYSLQNYGKIRDEFSTHLKGWQWSRLPLLTQAVLIKSYAHSKIDPVDKKVIINIGVNYAKKYIEPKQAKFINAILDEVLN